MSLPENEENENKHEKLVNRWSDETFMNMRKLILYEEKNVRDLLEITSNIASAMLGPEGLRTSKNTGVLNYNRIRMFQRP